MKPGDDEGKGENKLDVGQFQRVRESEGEANTLQGRPLVLSSLLPPLPSAASLGPLSPSPQVP